MELTPEDKMEIEKSKNPKHCRAKLKMKKFFQAQPGMFKILERNINPFKLME
jgi:hypothetical protein